MRTGTRRADPGAFADDIAATVAADLSARQACCPNPRVVSSGYRWGHAHP